MTSFRKCCPDDFRKIRKWFPGQSGPAWQCPCAWCGARLDGPVTGSEVKAFRWFCDCACGTIAGTSEHALWGCPPAAGRAPGNDVTPLRDNALWRSPGTGVAGSFPGPGGCLFPLSGGAARGIPFRSRGGLWRHSLRGRGVKILLGNWSRRAHFWPFQGRSLTSSGPVCRGFWPVFPEIGPFIPGNWPFIPGNWPIFLQAWPGNWSILMGQGLHAFPINWSISRA